MMDSESNRERDGETDGSAEAQAPEAEAGGEQVDSPVVEDQGIPSVDDDAARIARLEAELAEQKDRVLRQVAETENVRRRLQRDKDDAVRYAALPLIRDLLGVVDNLERALDSLPEDKGPDDGPLAQLVAGLELTRRELAGVFERHKVVPIEAQGAPFDPNRHEAMFEVPNPDVPSGTVIQVLQPGFIMHDRLVRPARVGVAKGGPPPAPPEPRGAGPTPANDDAPRPGSHIDTEA
jgi:molecular chaperone GrpE